MPVPPRIDAANLGGAMYEGWLKPIIGASDPSQEIRWFWLTFAGMGIFATAGLIAYNAFLSHDTPVANAVARRITMAVYTLLLVSGLWFLQSSVFAEGGLQYKTMIQSVIMVLLGGGGLYVSVRRKT